MVRAEVRRLVLPSLVLSTPVRRSTFVRLHFHPTHLAILTPLLPIAIVDDPLSAVDAHVGRHLFDRVLGPEGLLKDKARILCTNAIPYVEQADEILFLRKGVILERSTYAKAIEGETDLSKLLHEFGKKGGDGGEGSSDDGSGSETAANSGDETAVEEPEQDEATLDAQDLELKLKQQKFAANMRKAIPVPVEEQKMETLKHLKRSTRPKEHREQGSVKWDVYKNYIRANGILGVRLSTFLFPFFLLDLLTLRFRADYPLPWLDRPSATPPHRQGRLAQALGDGQLSRGKQR